MRLIVLLLFAVPCAAEAQFAPRVHGDTMWTTSSVGVMRSIHRGDTIWTSLTTKTKPPDDRRYVVRGEWAYTTIDGYEIKVARHMLPDLKMAEKAREVDSLQAAALQHMGGKPPE